MCKTKGKKLLNSTVSLKWDSEKELLLLSFPDRTFKAFRLIRNESQNENSLTFFELENIAVSPENYKLKTLYEK